MNPVQINCLQAQTCVYRREDLVAHTVYALGIITATATVLYFALSQATDLSHLIGLGHRATCLTLTAGGGSLLALLTAGIAREYLRFDQKLEDNYLRALATRMGDSQTEAHEEFKHLLRLSPRLYRRLLHAVHQLKEAKKTEALKMLCADKEAIEGFVAHGFRWKGKPEGFDEAFTKVRKGVTAIISPATGRHNWGAYVNAQTYFTQQVEGKLS